MVRLGDGFVRIFLSWIVNQTLVPKPQRPAFYWVVSQNALGIAIWLVWPPGVFLPKMGQPEILPRFN